MRRSACLAVACTLALLFLSSAASAQNERIIPSSTLVAGAVDSSGGPLMFNRMVSFYGHPWSAQMGVLGQYPPEEMIRLLKDRQQPTQP